MNYDERAAIVQRLTAASFASPALYRARVLFWIAFGYVLVGTLLLLALLSSVGIVAALVVSKNIFVLKFAILPIVFAFMLLRALFVRIDPPQGRVLRRREAPKLFAMIEEIRKRAGVGALHDVQLVGDMNAAIVETPRFGGLFGWRRHLLIGLPLLLTHSTAEMRAILAHELGHLSGKHGRIGAWSWRVRETWSRVLGSLDARSGVVTRVLRRLFHWYGDHLMATTLVQARTHEFDADRLSAEITNAETAARALAWACVVERLANERFWTPLWESLAERPTPPPPLDSFLRRRAEILAPPYDDVLNEELARLTSIDDTHPALRERLQRLGFPRPAIALADRTAADELFGRATASFAAEFDRDWIQNAKPMWEQRRQEVEAARAQLAAAEATDDATPEDERLHTRAESLSQLGKEDESFDLYAALAERNPNDARAAFHLGRMLVARGDLAGIRHLSRAMEIDWRFVAPSCEIAYAALRNKGLDRDADTWGERYRHQCELIQAAQAETWELAVKDDLSQTTLDAATQQVILDHCRAAKWIGRVWIARKNLKRLPTGVEFVAVRAKMFRFGGQKRLQKLAETLNVQQDVMVYLVVSGSLMRRLDRLGARRS
jgi:Zn-dependent protease with chaperone function